jgi:hypothetical protein
MMRRARRLLHSLYVRAFPPDQLPLGHWLIDSGLARLRLADPDPNAPTPETAVLREGALLYEIDGEPDAHSHERGRP